MRLIELTQKNKLFIRGASAARAFDKLKREFTLEPILMHDDQSKSFIIKANASDFALGSILSHITDDRKLHPIAFHSRKF